MRINIYEKKFPQNPFFNNNNRKNENINFSNEASEIKEIDSNYSSHKEEIKNDSLNENHDSEIKITDESKNNSSIEPITEENIQKYRK